MIKQMIFRGCNSFAYSIAITCVLQIIVTVIYGETQFIPLLPEYMAHFSNPYLAMLVQHVFIGLTSASFGAGSVIFELERLSLLVQSILYYIVTSLVWIPISCFWWGLHKYPQTLVTVGVSYAVSYAISWIVQYRLCRRNIEEINQRIQILRQEK